MNPYLLQVVGKWLGLLIVFLTSVGNPHLGEKTIVLKNNNLKKSNTPVVEIINYKTKIKYNNSLPSNIIRTLVEGKNGIVSYSLNNKNQIVRPVVDEVVEKGRAKEGNFIGRLTGYGPDCAGCTGSGVVSCRTPNNKRYSLVKDGIIYKDEFYGDLRILAATKNIFPCGTIVKVQKPNDELFLGIVLDTGETMRKAWSERGQIWFDLAFKTEKDPEIYKATSSNVKYEVQRWGW